MSETQDSPAALADSSVLWLLGTPAIHTTTMTLSLPMATILAAEDTVSLWSDYALSLTEISKSGVGFFLCPLLGCQTKKETRWRFKAYNNSVLYS